MVNLLQGRFPNMQHNMERLNSTGDCQKYKADRHDISGCYIYVFYSKLFFFRFDAYYPTQNGMNHRVLQ